MNLSHPTLVALRRFAQGRNGTELLWVMLGQLAGALGSLAAVRLLTNYLQPEAYGEVALGNTIALLVNQTLFGPLMNAYVRYWSIYKERQQTKVFLRVAFQLVAWLSVGFILVASLIWLILLSKAPKWIGIGIFGSLLALISGYLSMLNGLQLAERQRKIVAWHQALIQWIQPIAAIGLILLFTQSSAIAMLGYLIGSTITLISQLLLFQPILKLKQQTILPISPQEIRLQLLTYAYPFASWGILTWLQLISDRWSLQAFYGQETVGFYTVLYQLGYQPIVLFGSICMQFIYPILFEQAGDNSNIGRVKNAIRLWLKVMIVMTGFSCLCVVIAILFHYPILQMFSAPEYSKFSQFLPLIVISSTLFNLAQIMSLIPLLFSDSKALLLPKISTSLIAMTLNLILVYQYSLGGAIVANIISALFYLVWVARICHQKINNGFSF